MADAPLFESVPVILRVGNLGLRESKHRTIELRRRGFKEKTPVKMRNFNLEYYLVAFLGMQGQREKFRALRLPKNPEEETTVGEVLRQTAGFVLDLRKAFGEQFQRFEAGASSLMQRHTKQPVRPKFVGFSDSFVTSIPLRNQGGDLVGIVAVF